MRSIELLWLAGTRLLAAVLLAVALLPGVLAARWPKYGGTLRIELRAGKISLDPREWKVGTAEFATNEKLGALVFDRLVALDNHGRFQPQLATAWSHDPGFKRWQFTMRAGAKFSDGSLLNAADIMAALQPLLPDGQQINASASGVVIQSATATPDLLEELATGRYFIYRVQPDGTLMGTGPFFVSGVLRGGSDATDALPATNDSSGKPPAHSVSDPTHLHFRANEETWCGRPFLDEIDVTLGVAPLRQLLDLQLGKADLVEISPELVRRATQENLRVWSSAPVTLYGLRFDETGASATDATLREAVALTLDRKTMANVLLQKQAEPASALLPQWLSGYAFLFNMEPNLPRAKEIRAALPAKVATVAEPLWLRVDAPGDLAKLLGERVAVNARQAAILVHVVNRALPREAGSTTTTSSDSGAGFHLFAWHYSALSPRVEMESFVSALNVGSSSKNAVSITDPEQLYARERKLLEEHRILPLVALPESVGLGPNVRDWMPARWGEWRLADVWLDLPEPAPALTESIRTTQPPAASPGATP
jgi:peptide/nickel transport system substrate-binding protein